MTTPESAVAPAGTVGAVVRPVILQDCDCDGFRKGSGIWFDSQDLREFNFKACPACHKPFKTWPSEEAYLADQQPNAGGDGRGASPRTSPPPCSALNGGQHA